MLHSQRIQKAKRLVNTIYSKHFNQLKFKHIKNVCKLKNVVNFSTNSYFIAKM